LNGPVEQVAKLLVERSERATRLRQSSPFTGVLTETERLAIYESYSTRTYHSAASQISGDAEIVVIGSQAIHAQRMKLPPIAFQSDEADVNPRNHPERTEEIDAAIGELSPFHDTHGYYGHGGGPTTAILAASWEQRVVRLSNPNTGGATGLCIDVHDLVLSKYAAGRERDMEFNRELERHGIVSRRKLTRLLPSMPLDDEHKRLIRDRIKRDFAAANSRSSRKPPPS
jgi:hypothetical protein